MRKFWIVLLLALAFCSEAIAGPMYQLSAKGSKVQPVYGYPTCHSERLSRDHFRVAVIDDTWARVNYKVWYAHVEHDVAGYTWYTFSFKANPEAFTFLQFFLVANDRVIGGKLQLFGRLPDRRKCADEVEVIGFRL